ncbi:MAG TPA: MBL fold metallo-hydrolase [Thermomicrobiales bacterium]|nr:MBL fold metallo-hydrolase [Thermomicrobiales bacterium]
MPQPLTLDWYAISNPSSGVFALLEPLQVERVLSYLIVGKERALLIDTGTGAVSMKAAIETLTDLPVLLVNSHSHWDHVGGNHEFDEIAIHRAEAHELAHEYSCADIAEFFGEGSLLGPLPAGRSIESITIGPSTPTRLLDGGESFDLGGRTITALHTPGHAPGLLSLLDEANGVLFSTDTAYPGPLYAYSDDTDLEAYIRSMALLAELAPSLRYVHPSHNADIMPAALLPRMRDALIEVANGKMPDSTDPLRATYHFDGFGIYGPLPGERR